MLKILREIILGSVMSRFSIICQSWHKIMNIDWCQANLVLRNVIGNVIVFMLSFTQNCHVSPHSTKSFLMIHFSQSLVQEQIPPPTSRDPEEVWRLSLIGTLNFKHLLNTSLLDKNYFTENLVKFKTFLGSLYVFSAL